MIITICPKCNKYLKSKQDGKKRKLIKYKGCSLCLSKAKDERTKLSDKQKTNDSEMKRYWEELNNV